MLACLRELFALILGEDGLDFFRLFFEEFSDFFSVGLRGVLTSFGHDFTDFGARFFHDGFDFGALVGGEVQRFRHFFESLSHLGGGTFWALGSCNRGEEGKGEGCKDRDELAVWGLKVCHTDDVNAGEGRWFHEMLDTRF